MNKSVFSIDPIQSPTSHNTHGDQKRVRWAFLGILPIIMVIWAIWILATLLGWPMDSLGVKPREIDGLIGVLTAPVAHGSFSHLVSNTLPLLLLGWLLLYTYPRAVRWALPVIWLGSGLLVWLFARPSTHIGISGVTHGLMFFLFLIGLLRRDRKALTMALIAFFLYGSMLITIFPREPEISWESHLAGAVMGVFAALFLRNADPYPPRKLYSWDMEPEEEFFEEQNDLTPKLVEDIDKRKNDSHQISSQG